MSPPRIYMLSAVGEAPLDLETIDLDVGQANDGGVLFRYAHNRWIYNLRTWPLSRRKVYEIVIEMPDGQLYAARFALR